MRLYSDYGTLHRCALDFGERFSSLDEIYATSTRLVFQIFFRESPLLGRTPHWQHGGDAKETGEIVSRKHLPNLNSRIRFPTELVQ